MKNHLKLSLFLFMSSCMVQAGDNKGIETSRTFFWIRPPFQSSMPEKETLWRDRGLAKECGWSSAVQLVPFGGKSTNATDMAQYFMICTKSELVVAEQNAFGAGALTADPNLRDVNANQFNINTQGNDFKSTIAFRPRHSFYGVGIDYRQYLHRRDACEKKWWGEISFPVMHVRNDIHLEEDIGNNGTPLNSDVNASMKEAFKGLKGFVRPTDGVITGSVWKYGKIDGAQQINGIADVEVKLGYDFICQDSFHSEAYAGIVIPTGNSPKAEFVFEPMLGHNRHAAFMWGSAWGWEIWNRCDSYLHLEMASNSRYFLERKEWRSFDVKGKPWSRYMVIYNSASETAAQVGTNGINVFTQKLKIDPRYMHNLNTALVYTRRNFQAEFGYNFWAKISEKVEFDKPWQEGPALVRMNDIGIPLAAISRAITIKENFPNSFFAYTDDTIIHQQDLDLSSAASPAAVTHTLYGSAGYRWDDWCCPVFIGVGGSYELSQSHGAISRWTAWGKFGVSL